MNYDQLPVRRANDVYETAPDLVEAAINLLPINDSQPVAAYDPGAGSGVWGTYFKKRFPIAIVDGSDIRDLPKPDAYNFWRTRFDFSSEAPPQYAQRTYSYVIGNPPYQFAEQFVRNGLKLLRSEGYLLFLLPLNFLAAQKRSGALPGKLFFEFVPTNVWIVSKRPSFSGNRRTQIRTEYCLILWQKHIHQITQLDWMTY